MLGKIKSVATVIAMGITITTILLLWGTAFSAHMSPEHFGWYGVAGLAFPVFALINALLLLMWLVCKPKLAIVPLLGFLFCISDLRAYCPVNIPQKPPHGSLKIMSYNTKNFDGTGTEDTPEKKQIIETIINSDADVICIQEGDYWADWKKLESKLRNIYMYMDVLGQGSTPTTMRCFSKLPILKAELIPFPGSYNRSVAYYLRHSSGDTIIVLSNHLQSDNITPAELCNYSSIVKGKKDAGGVHSKAQFVSLFKKLSFAAERRATQVDSITSFIAAHSRTPMIVCGDFNDTPISYTRREIAANLTDAYVSTGFGPGFSYNSNGMHVRIDHIMCSRHWKPYAAKVLDNAKGSDHYPITAFFKLKAK